MCEDHLVVNEGAQEGQVCDPLRIWYLAWNRALVPSSVLKGIPGDGSFVVLVTVRVRSILIEGGTILKREGEWRGGEDEDDDNRQGATTEMGPIL